MTLCPDFSKCGCPLLVSKLDKAKGRLETVNKQHLDIFLIDGCMDLVKDFNEQVIGEIISRSEDMDPCVLPFRIRVIQEASQRILQGKISSDFVV